MRFKDATEFYAALDQVYDGNSEHEFSSSLTLLNFSLNTITGVRHFDFLTKLLHFNGKNLSLTQLAITCLKLTVEVLERRSRLFIVNFDHISHLVLVFLLLTLTR